jgi:precorrin-2 dehydrogenase/sirohydrochlorin ferrochelatase
MMMNLTDRGVAVVGGGKVAARKIEALLMSGARITVISPRVTDEVASLARGGRLRWVEEEFREELLDDIPDLTLVFGATDDRKVGKALYEAATRRRTPCNIADDPELCSFILPASLTRGRLTICVSSGGASPALSRRVREDLERRYGHEYAALTHILAALREKIISLGRPSEENRDLFFRVVDSDLLHAIKERDLTGAVEILGSILPEGVSAQALINGAMSDTQEEDSSIWT